MVAALEKDAHAKDADTTPVPPMAAVLGSCVTLTCGNASLPVCAYVCPGYIAKARTAAAHAVTILCLKIFLVFMS